MISTTGVLLVNLFLVGLLTVAGWRSRRTPGARAFTALQFVSAAWLALSIIGLSMRPGPVRLRVWGVTVAASLVVAALWLAFILSYTGREQWLRPRRIGLVVAPLGVGATLYAVAPSWPVLVNETRQALTPAGTLVEASIGPAGSLLGVYLYAVFLIGLVVVARTALTETRVFVGQVAALVLGTLVTVGASGARILGYVPVPGYPMTQVAIGAQSLLWGYAVFSRDLLGQVPAIARIGERTVFENIDDGLLVTDGSGIIVKANRPAEMLFDRSEVVGLPLSTLLTEVGVGVETLPQQFQRGGRTYSLTESTMTDWHDQDIGSAYVFRDVTELLQHQQRLEVLNRVLRHNVRNELTVIRGSANVIAERADDDAAVLGDRIVDHADRLMTVGEKARELEHVFDTGTAGEAVDPDALLTDVVESVTDTHPDGTVSISVEASPLRVNRPALSLVLREAVENALEHAGPDPTVTVAVRERDSDAEFVVSDDGPGIPESELEPVRSGEETKLTHMTGLGLWLINWGAQSLGGFVRIEATEGTTVRLLVPADQEQLGTRRTAPDPLNNAMPVTLDGMDLDAAGGD